MGLDFDYMLRLRNATTAQLRVINQLKTFPKTYLSGYTSNIMSMCALLIIFLTGNFGDVRLPL
jgi:hypothetical protein